MPSNKVLFGNPNRISTKACCNKHKPQYRNLGNSLCDIQDLTRVREDQCYINRRNCDSTKPLKYITYHYHPFGCETQSTCYPGQNYEDGFGVSACNIADESMLKLDGGNILTNKNIKQNLQMFPLHMPRIRGYRDIDAESDLVCPPTDVFSGCSSAADSEKSQIPYTFEYFDDLCYNPQETRYIIPEDTFKNAFNDQSYHRGGKLTRFDRLGNYRNNCDMFSNVMVPQGIGHKVIHHESVNKQPASLNHQSGDYLSGVKSNVRPYDVQITSPAYGY